jgi:ribosomal-protein-alanine N-acetyltransferase
MCYGDEAHITTIAVDPTHHRRKIGTRLLYELVQEGIRLGGRAVSLEVRVSNWGAQELYRKFRFRPVGTRKNYYQETGEDALVMWADEIRTREYRAHLDAIVSRIPDGVRPT